MELSKNQALAPGKWNLVPFEEWSNDLLSVCGHFNPVAINRGSGVYGGARAITAGGMHFAHISNDLDRVYRTKEDIKRDDHEHLFLIFQIEGRCGLEQVGRQNFLEVGDCILLDSTKPSVFHPGGHFSNHLSLHLPRQTMYSQASVSFDIARKITSDDPMAVMLKALIAKVMQTQSDGPSSPHLRDLVFNATREVFISDRQDSLQASCSCVQERVAVIDGLIDRHLTNSKLSARWLADRVGISIRTLQEDLQGLGVTCTTIIRNRRLRLAHEMIKQIHETHSRRTIAEIAYSTGFNDISYFNRSFKDMFHCTPTDLLKQR